MGCDVARSGVWIGDPVSDGQGMQDGIFVINEAAVTEPPSFQSGWCVIGQDENRDRLIIVTDEINQQLPGVWPSDPFDINLLGHFRIAAE